jgi:hypothetical protein
MLILWNILSADWNWTLPALGLTSYRHKKKCGFGTHISLCIAQSKFLCSEWIFQKTTFHVVWGPVYKYLVLFTWFFLFSLLLWPQKTNGSCRAVHLAVVKVLRDTATGAGELRQHIVCVVIFKSFFSLFLVLHAAWSLCKHEIDNYSFSARSLFSLSSPSFGRCSSPVFFNIRLQQFFLTSAFVLVVSLFLQ